MAARKRNGRPGWSFVFDLEPGPDGKRRQRMRSGFKTKREAEAAERDERALIDKGIIISDDSLTVGTYLLQWLAHKKPQVAYATYVGYEGFARLHLIPSLGRIELRKLRPLEIQSAYRAITDKGLSANSAHHAHVTLHLALAQAVLWQLIPRNPADAVEKPRILKRVVKTPTVAELNKLLAEGDKTSQGAVFRLIAMTGVRRGEALGLHWRNVYLDSSPRTITVAEAAQRQVKRGIIFKDPKSEESQRSIVLLPETVTMLREHRRKQEAEKAAEHLDYQDTGLVFATPLGLPYDGNNLWRTWAGVANRAGVGHVTLHDLRHTHATLLLQAGVHPKVVQERLGHRSIEITMNLYSHVTPTMQAEAVEKLGRMLEE